MIHDPKANQKLLTLLKKATIIWPF